MASDNIDTYGVLAGNVLDLNFGNSKITGDVGSYNTITGSGTMSVTGATNTGSSIDSALSNASGFYTELMSITPDTTSSASNIAGMTFNPGFNELTNASVTISGSTPQVTLDGNGIYIFQLPNGDLTTDPTSDQVYFNFLNGAVASNVYWLVSGDVNLQTIGNITSFAGTVLCQGNITVGVSSTSAGGLIAFSSSPDGTITLNQSVAICRNSQVILDESTDDYINIKTTLADSQAIQINAANPNGGILINAGFGGIRVDTTNAISLNASAASNLSTTLGDVAIQSAPAVVNLDGGAGINIGTDQDLANTNTPIITPVINIGTAASEKTINIGNTTDATEVNITSGSGNITLNSDSGQVVIVGNNSSGSAIDLDASSGSNGITALTGTGGFTLNSGTGKTQIVSNNTSVDAIRLDASGSTGGVLIAAGSSGINIGNDSIAHPIVLGNTTGTSSLALHAGSFGLTIGNDSSSGEIQIANSATAKAITIGNTASGSRLVTRWQSVWIKHQESYIALFDNDVNPVSGSTFFAGIFAGPIGGSLSANRVLTLDTSANFLSAFGGSVAVGDAIDFTIINTSAASNFYYSLTMGTNGTMIGDNKIYPTNNTDGGSDTYVLSNSTTFRLVITSISGSGAYTVFRL